MLCCRLLSLFIQTHTMSRWHSKILTDIQEENVCSQNNLSPVYHNYRRNRNQKTKQATFEKANGHKLNKFSLVMRIIISHKSTFSNSQGRRKSPFGVKLVR